MEKDKFKISIKKASLLMDKHLFKEASIIYEQLIADFPQSVPIGVYVRLCVAYRKLNNIKKSKELISYLSNSNKTNYDFFLEAANVSLFNNEWENAIDYIKEAKKLKFSYNDKIVLDIQIISIFIKFKKFDKAFYLINFYIRQESYLSHSINQQIRTLLAKLRMEEEILRVNDPWKTYWNLRKNFIYLHVVKNIMIAVGSSAETILDVGSNRTPVLEFLPNVKNRYSIDPTTPYEEEGIISIKEDFLYWKPQLDRKIQLGTCLQVMEHVSDPKNFAKKLLEICEVVIISVPYKEKPGVNPGHLNSMIDLKIIQEWFNKSPNYHYIAKEMSGEERIICLFDNKSDEKYHNFNTGSTSFLRFKFRWSLNGSGI